MLQLEIDGIDRDLIRAPQAPLLSVISEAQKKIGLSFTCQIVITLCRRVCRLLQTRVMRTAKPVRLLSIRR